MPVHCRNPWSRSSCGQLRAWEHYRQGPAPRLPLDPASHGASLATLAALPTLLNFIVTANGVPALFTPLARSLAEGSGMPLLTVLMLQVIGYATPLLPYQASPIVVAMGMEKVPARDGLRLCLTMAVATFGLLLPLYYAVQASELDPVTGTVADCHEPCPKATSARCAIGSATSVPHGQRSKGKSLPPR